MRLTPSPLMTLALCTTLVLPGLAAAAERLAPPTRASCDAAPATVLQPPRSVPADARAVWLDRQRLRWPGADTATPGLRHLLVHAAGGTLSLREGEPVQGADAVIALQSAAQPTPAALRERFRWVGEGPEFTLRAADQPRLATLLRGQLMTVQTDAQGRVLRATALQTAAALDELYAAAEKVGELGATPPPAGTPAARASTGFRLWAPTARAVWLCVHADGRAPARLLLPLVRDPLTGIWSKRVPGDLSGQTYTYLVDVHTRSAGLVRNRVTDPYALSLSADSRRTWIGRLDSPAVTPPGWPGTRPAARVAHAVDQVIYELHVRDFSLGDERVPPAHRGTYLGFTHPDSHGMRHLRAAGAAGLTDVHLLPVFDLATVPEQGCRTPDAAQLQALAARDPASPEPQARVAREAAADCFNWGYDPLHFGAPEGSFATDAMDGAVRLREFRQMVMALHAAGLRVGMDVVYNHMSASGQSERSVLDRIVPGYYHRLDTQGRVTTSTCCDNTATEHRMMARLMIDTAVVWARDHHVDSFRFDLMGHQPREAMERLQRAVSAAVAPQGRRVDLIGEGWNFGEIANGARFVQASQLSLNGSGIGSFSDRGRDAARGGGCCDGPEDTLRRQGWLNGLHAAPNGHGSAGRDELLRAADLVRLGLAGTLRGYRFTTADGRVRAGSEIEYAGQPAGFASQPGEVVNYVENHDNQTLWDIHTLKLPRATPAAERARVQVLGLALTAFSQGIAYYHAGVELLRSKSGDRNSFDSGDWFNRLDYTLTDNGWGAGLPPEKENAPFWPLLRERLADPAMKPAPADIRFARDAWLDLLKIRASSSAFRLRSAEEVQRRLVLHDTGPGQLGTLMLGQLDARGLADGGGFAELVFAINAAPTAATVSVPALAGRAFELHPVHLAPQAADARVRDARFDAASGTLTVPPRTALVWVRR